jgi:hypothetical protein
MKSLPNSYSTSNDVFITNSTLINDCTNLEEKIKNENILHINDFTFTKNKVETEEEVNIIANTNLDEKETFADKIKNDFKLELISSKAYKKFLVNKIFNNSLAVNERKYDIEKKYKSLDLVSNVIKLYRNYNKNLNFISRAQNINSSSKKSLEYRKISKSSEESEEYHILSHNLKGKNKRYVINEFSG